MKLTLRLILSLFIGITLVVAVFSWIQINNEKKQLQADIERRSIILAESLRESVSTLIETAQIERLNRLVEKFGNRERLKGVAVFDASGNIISSDSFIKSHISKTPVEVVNVLAEKKPKSNLIKIEKEKFYIYVVPIFSDAFEEKPLIGALALFQDASYIDIRLKEMWKQNILRLLALTISIVTISLLVIKWNITGPVARMAEWLKELRTGKIKNPPSDVPVKGDVLAPLANEVTNLIKTLSMIKAKAEEEERFKAVTDSLWTAERLKEFIRMELGDKKLFLISNREPYMHIREGENIKCVVPAGGLVTALDPVMKACDGVWIAHGAGDADKEVVDTEDKIRVPPEKPSYTLKRVWLTKEEEKKYYYGFSNEGLWPLCHITYVRPVFRKDDWIEYQKVNEKFANALLDEIKDEDSPLVLVQDYHLALVPLLIKQKRPDAKIALFWHIPWPNPEVFGICPWAREILIGMLGADLIGFHIQFYCNNFLDTVDRFLESKIDWEHFSIERRGQITTVKPFPISVSVEDFSDNFENKAELKVKLLKELGITAEHIGVGVDRIDYTKGILERFLGIERFLEKYPQFIGKFSFIQFGSPSRTHIKQYREIMDAVEEVADRINWKFQSNNYKPIIFLKGYHSHSKIIPFYKVADICMVTSLHDGMNLVAKEFIASRDDESGVLILSQFAGASRELKDAIIINPYDIESIADAIYEALIMDEKEKTERMRKMRSFIQERNIYRWTRDLIAALVRL
ncbi:trehalose 6-phosphate synthase [Thermodesulfovibrio aggregans]|uniref:Trehalose 6-phosphate synthase n=1 Tax=Thermodesulfovibrio aggregans TaxID=86166 RepID=A0A0U9HX90_9BACT|nr:trehalose-6-phosphate synthase [Thermodesulfovibrio aggregans]GAQ95533.1 trehalose 6-phosphate synthase [Thermodesulfovibrio aggregans]